jgi:hypothetical protein
MLLNLICVYEYAIFQFNDDVLMMVNRQGQEYACTLPIIPLDLKSSGSKDETAAQVETVDISGMFSTHVH